MTYQTHFYSDPSHGWLAVSTADLVALGIEREITRYSYLSADRRTAYLEEDCDYGTFQRALFARGITIAAKELYRDGDSPVRDLERYDVARIVLDDNLGLLAQMERIVLDDNLGLLAQMEVSA